jgi:hypothetical protein
MFYLFFHQKETEMIFLVINVVRQTIVQTMQSMALGAKSRQRVMSIAMELLS